MECGVDSLPEIAATYKGSIFNRDGIPVDVHPDTAVDLSHTGTQTVHYTVSYENINSVLELVIHVVDTTPPDIDLISDPEHFTSPVESYAEEGYSATDLCDGDLTYQVQRVERQGYVYYNVSDNSGNRRIAVRRIVYKDVIPPDLLLQGESQMTLEAGSDFKEPGYDAADDVDGPLADQVHVSGSVDGHTPGSYTLTYTVSDSSDNETSVHRIVTVADTRAPELSLSGETSVYIQVGSAYNEPGYSAVDSFEGDLSHLVQISGSVDTASYGVYTLNYTVSDTAGNQTSTSRTVYVYRQQAAVSDESVGDKVVYLTFDDGPGRYTRQLLDLLDQYNVKVTFFVTNQFPAYQDMIGEAYRRGHTIAIHSYSHSWSIYDSEAAFYEDIVKMRDICIAQTGVAPTILRFPGGSSNTISRSHSVGIMTALTQSVGIMGYQYADWNVTSGDAGDTTDTEVIINNVIRGMQSHNASVVLQHDIHLYSVNAVERILQWGLANGYTFLPMTDNSPMVHHGVNN